MCGLECMLYFTLEFVSKQLADVLGFVFTKSRLRTRYESLFLVFSGRLHDAIMSGMMSLTVENVFMENNIFRECVFGRWQWERCFWKPFGFFWVRMMYLLDNNNFQIALYFNWFCMSTFWTWLRWFLWRTFIFLDWHFCNATERCICNMCKCMSLGYFLLQLEFGIWYSGSEVHLACARWFKHVARQNKRETRTTLHSGRQSQDKLPLLVLCVARKRWERGQVRICGFSICVCLQVVFIGIAA